MLCILKYELTKSRFTLASGLTTIFLFMMAAIFHMRNYDHEYAAILFEKFLLQSSTNLSISP